MITYDLNWGTVPANHRLTPTRLSRVAQAFLNALPKISGQVAVSFVEPEIIKKLNAEHRGKDQITDVLSFADAFPELSGMLGDVIICFQRAVEQAGDGDIELELTDLIVHGILHLLGYDHEEPSDASIMFTLQDQIVAQSL